MFITPIFLKKKIGLFRIDNETYVGPGLVLEWFRARDKG